MSKSSLRLTEPEVLHVRADIGDFVETNLEWNVTYSAAAPVDSPWDGRVVIAKIIAASGNASASVTVAAFLNKNTPEIISADLYESALRESDALDTLWHYARIALAPSLAVIQSDIDIPVESPTPITRELSEPA
jgi:hypothetical protein